MSDSQRSANFTISAGDDGSGKVAVLDCIVADPANYPEWAGRANGFYNPLGSSSAIGYFLVTQESLLKVVKASTFSGRNENFAPSLTQSITINAGEKLKLSSLLIISAQRITLSQSDQSVYLLKVADKRWLCSKAINNAVDEGGPSSSTISTAEATYNVRKPAPATVDDPMSQSADFYYFSSLNVGSSGDPWTWTDMLQSLWGYGATALGAWPGLPDTFTTPDKKPEGFRFSGTSGWAALNSVLALLNMAVSFDPVAGTYSIIDLTVAQNGLNKIISSNNKLYDATPYRTEQATYFNDIWVMFNRINRHYGTELTIPGHQDADAAQAWEEQSFVPSQFILSDPNAATARFGLWDDLPAIVEIDGTVTNYTDLNARATERKTRFLAQIDNADKLSRMIFDGVVAEFKTGSNVKAVWWHSFGDGQGWQTEIVGHAGLPHDDERYQFAEDGIGGYVEENLRAPDLARRTHPNQIPQAQVVRPTSTTKNDSGFYPGVIRRCDPSSPSSGAYEEVTCWIYAPGSTGIDTDQVYLGKLFGSAADSSDARPIFFVQLFNENNAQFVTVIMSDDFTPGATVDDCSVTAHFPTGSEDPGGTVTIQTAYFTGSDGDNADAFYVSPGVYRMVSHTPAKMDIALGDGTHGTQSVVTGY